MKDSSDFWHWVGFFVLMYVIGQCSSTSGPQYPGDHTNEGAEYQADMMEAELNNRNYEDYLDTTNYDDPIDPYESSAPAACNIKGNISFDTGAKIYHMPGQEYYEATTINTSYGERWFCTEEEARAAGWRKSQQ